MTRVQALRQGDYPGLDRHGKRFHGWRSARALSFFAGIVVIAIISPSDPASASAIEGKTEAGDVSMVEDIDITNPPNAPNMDVNNIGAPYILVQNMEKSPRWTKRAIWRTNNSGRQFIPSLAFTDSWINGGRNIRILASNAVVKSKPHFGNASNGPAVVADDQFKVVAEVDSHSSVVFCKPWSADGHKDLRPLQGPLGGFTSYGTSPGLPPKSSGRDGQDQGVGRDGVLKEPTKKSVDSAYRLIYVLLLVGAGLLAACVPIGVQKGGGR